MGATLGFICLFAVVFLPLVIMISSSASRRRGYRTYRLPYRSYGDDYDDDLYYDHDRSASPDEQISSLRGRLRTMERLGTRNTARGKRIERKLKHLKDRHYY